MTQLPDFQIWMAGEPAVRSLRQRDHSTPSGPYLIQQGELVGRELPGPEVNAVAGTTWCGVVWNPLLDARADAFRRLRDRLTIFVMRYDYDFEYEIDIVIESIATTKGQYGHHTVLPLVVFDYSFSTLTEDVSPDEMEEALDALGSYGALLSVDRADVFWDRYRCRERGLSGLWGQASHPELPFAWPLRVPRRHLSDSR